MKDPDMQLNNPGGENPNGMEEVRSMDNTGSEQYRSISNTSVGDYDLHGLRTQNINQLRAILDDLLARYEELKRCDDNESTGRVREVLQEIRLVMKLMDSLINSLQNPKNGAATERMLTEAGAALFGSCVDKFIHSVDRILREGFSADDQDKANRLLNLLVAEFDEAFREFGTCDEQEEGLSHE